MGRREHEQGEERGDDFMTCLIQSMIPKNPREETGGDMVGRYLRSRWLKEWSLTWPCISVCYMALDSYDLQLLKPLGTVERAHEHLNCTRPVFHVRVSRGTHPKRSRQP